MIKVPDGALIGIAAALSLAGLAAFLFLFIRDFSIYWLILSPVILAIYQFPAYLVFRVYRKRRPIEGRREQTGENDPTGGESC